MSVLYLSYNGLMEPIGQSQILPYLRELARGRRITLITYEKPHDLDDAERRKKFDRLVQDSGIAWIPLRYHRAPAVLSTAYDLCVGFLTCVRVCLTKRVRIVHARSTVPAVMGLFLKLLFGMRLIFDTRGFWIDERLKWGLFREDALDLRIARFLECQLLKRSDAIFVLSDAAAAAMKCRPEVAASPDRVHVATTCTDLERFHPGERQNGRPLTLGYVGTAGHGYLFEPVLDLFMALRKRRGDVRLKVVNRSDHPYIRSAFAARGVPESAVELVASDHVDMPSHIRDMDAGVFFYAWSDAAVPPVFTRMGEFLACGIPCVSNVEGKGSTTILEAERVGVLVPDVSVPALAAAAERLLLRLQDPDLRSRCVASARQHFSLAAGLREYESVYQQLGCPAHG